MKISPISFDFNRPLVVFSSLQGQTQTLPRGHVYNDRSKNSMSKSNANARASELADSHSLTFSLCCNTERCASEADPLVRLERQPWTVLVSIRSALQHTRRLHELSRARIASLRRALLHSIRRPAGQQRHADYRRGTEVSLRSLPLGRGHAKLINRAFLSQQPGTHRGSVLDVWREGSQSNLAES